MPSGARRGPGGGGGGSSRPSAPVLFTPNFTPHASAETAGGMLALPGGRGTLVNPGVAKVTLDEQQRLIDAAAFDDDQDAGSDYDDDDDDDAPPMTPREIRCLARGVGAGGDLGGG